MIQKLNIGTTLAALVLFFLPWIDLRCSDKSLATQTGIQTIYGGGTPSADMAALENGQGAKSAGEKKDESMGYSPLVAIALLAVIGAVVAAFVSLRSADDLAHGNLVGILCAVALGLLALQMMIGFPAKKKLEESMAQGTKQQAPSNDPMAKVGEGMAAAMMMNFQVRQLPALYIELIMLGLPTLVLANGLIDKLKKK
jgi:hypothetical protein